MTIYNTIKKQLENIPAYRERRVRDNLFMKLLVEEYPFVATMDFKKLVEFAKTYDTLRHEWDAVTRENKELRGKDYDDKKVLMQVKMLEFDYQPGFNRKLF